MEKNLYRPDGSLYVSIRLIPEEAWIYVSWFGSLQTDMVKAGSEELLAMILETKIHKVLVSNQHVTGPWHTANEWYATDWNPRARAAGLTHMAVIVSDNVFAQLSLQGFEKRNNADYTVFSHYNPEVVQDWLRSMP